MCTRKGRIIRRVQRLTRLFIDEQELIDNWTQQTRGDTFFGRGSSEVQKAVALEAGREYLLKVEFAKTSPHITTLLSAWGVSHRFPCMFSSVRWLLRQAQTLLWFVWGRAGNGRVRVPTIWI